MGLYDGTTEQTRVDTPVLHHTHEELVVILISKRTS
jgi:hypothetical protein